MGPDSAAWAVSECALRCEPCWGEPAPAQWRWCSSGVLRDEHAARGTSSSLRPKDRVCRGLGVVGGPQVPRPGIWLMSGLLSALRELVAKEVGRGQAEGAWLSFRG